jgi:hypothetical protein
MSFRTGYDLVVTSRMKRNARALRRREFKAMIGGCTSYIDAETGALRLLAETPDREYELLFSREASDFIRERLVTRTTAKMGQR